MKDDLILILLCHKLIIRIEIPVIIVLQIYHSLSPRPLFPLPRGIQVPDALGLPLAMTMTLAASGIAANWAQLAMKTHNPSLPGGYDKAAVTKGLGTAIALGVFFLGLQVYEYINTAFCISDSAFGTCFYMATGLHGMHVLVGVGMLALTLLRHTRGHFTPWQHVGFESAVWYWQFVDVVWIVLYGAIYLWGGSRLQLYFLVFWRDGSATVEIMEQKLLKNCNGVPSYLSKRNIYNIAGGSGIPGLTVPATAAPAAH